MKKIAPNALIVLVLMIIPAAFAGQVDLTTYYPAPYGEYQELRSTGNSYFATTSGNVGIGTTSPSGQNQGLQVTGSTYFGSAYGLNSHLPWTDRNAYITGDNIYFRRGADAGYATRMSILSNGNVGIHDTSPIARLHVDGTGAPNGWGIYSFAWQGGVVGQTDGNNPGGVGVWGVNWGGGTGVFGSSGSGTGVAGSSPNIGVLGSSEEGAGAWSTGVSGTSHRWGVRGWSDWPAPNGTGAGVFGIGENSIGVLGRGSIGVFGGGTLNQAIGVSGTGLTGVQGNGNQQDFLLAGSGIMRSATGARGIIIQSSAAIAIQTTGANQLHLNPWPDQGLVVVGRDLQVNGRLTKGAGAFLIDHPLAPGNKILRHSFIESPEMVLIYKGRAKLKNGQAVIELPGYFDALNNPRGREISLTCVGGWSPLYLDGQISGNSFAVKTTTQGNQDQEFSWIVYGVRNDAFAQAYPVIVEEEKTRDGTFKKGEYIHPEVYDKKKKIAASLP